MTDLAKLLIAAFGGSGIALLAVALLVFKNPEKVEIWRSWVWRAARFVSRKAEYGYIAQDVASHINAVLADQLTVNIDGLPTQKVKIRWDNDAVAIGREIAGTIVVRMRPHEDRVSNILHAALAATRQMVVPTLRSRLSPPQSDAIDLQLCRRLAQGLSATAVTKYRLDILDPALQQVADLRPILEDLNALDLGGLFIPVYLQELTKTANQLLTGELSDISSEAASLAKFLVTVATRDPGEEVELTFIGVWIKINILLVARMETKLRGIAPYRSRVTRELAKGVDTIYVMATEANFTFADEVVSALDADRRLLKLRSKNLTIVRGGEEVAGFLVPFERNTTIAKTEYFSTLLDEAGISVGTNVLATVTDVQHSYVSVDINGLEGVIRPAECAWHHVTNCRDAIEIGEEFEVVVQGIDRKGLELQVSRRAALPNPFEAFGDEFFLGTAVVVEILGKQKTANGHRFVGREKETGVPIVIPPGELEWGNSQSATLLGKGTELRAQIYSVDREKGVAFASPKRLTEDKWPVLRERYARDSRWIATIVGIDARGITCELEPDVTGFVPASEFRQAGLEYTEYEQNFRIGQKLHVYVTRVVAGEKRRINLGLQVNL